MEMILGKNFLLTTARFMLIFLKQAPIVGAALEIGFDVAKELEQRQKDKSQDEKIQTIEEASLIKPQEARYIANQAVELLKSEGIEIDPEKASIVADTLAVMPSVITQKTRYTIAEAKNRNTSISLALPIDEQNSTIEERENFYRSLIPTHRPLYTAKTSVPNRGGWEFSELLGRGGFGEVWLIQSKTFGNSQALKLCLEEKSKNVLKREAENLKRLMNKLPLHENIVKVIDANLEVEPYFISFEYVEGGTLEDKIRGGGNQPIPLNDTIPLFLKICKAIAAAHDIGVIHRDLKPANILVDKNGEPKIADFGIGKVLAENNENNYSSTFTMAGAGTRGYMSPEQGNRNMPADPSDDVFSLAIILFQMLMGSINSDPHYMQDSLSKIGTPKDISKILVNCYLKPRGERPANAGILYEEMEKAYKRIGKREKRKAKETQSKAFEKTTEAFAETTDTTDKSEEIETEKPASPPPVSFSAPVVQELQDPIVPATSTKSYLVCCNNGTEKIKKMDFDGAIQEFTEALLFKPNSEIAYYHRGLAYQKKNVRDLARADYSKYLELTKGSLSPQTQQAQQKILRDFPEIKATL